MNCIHIRGLEICACHGVLDFEKVKKQRFIFSADMYYDFYLGAKDDSLSGTVNYSKACEIIAEIAQSKCCNLIESLAYDCAFELCEKFHLKKISLTVLKPDAPVNRKFESVGVTVELEQTLAYLSLGSSEGDRNSYLNNAINMLDGVRGIRVEKVSSFMSTPPYGGVAKNEFLNCAVEITTYLTPEQLLYEIHAIENANGRVRKEHWGDRTLDIDIILFGDKTVCTPELIIPHPEYKKRDFVLIPLKEIAPQFFTSK